MDARKIVQVLLRPRHRGKSLLALLFPSLELFDKAAYPHFMDGMCGTHDASCQIEMFGLDYRLLRWCVFRAAKLRGSIFPECHGGARVKARMSKESRVRSAISNESKLVKAKAALPCRYHISLDLLSCTSARLRDLEQLARADLSQLRHGVVHKRPEHHRHRENEHADDVRHDG